MKVYLYQSPGKNHGLHFHGISEEEKRRVKGFLNYNHSYLDAPHHKVVKAAHIFFQGDQGDWLFVEFWSEEPGWRPLIALLREELKLEILEEDPHQHG